MPLLIISLISVILKYAERLSAKREGPLVALATQQAATQLTVQCQSCSNKYGTPPYVDIPSSCSNTSFKPTSKPSYCPRCAHARIFRPYDYADVLCTEYFGLTRSNALQVIHLYNDLRASNNLDIRRIVQATFELPAATRSSKLDRQACEEVHTRVITSNVQHTIKTIPDSLDILAYLKDRGFKPMLQRAYIAPIDLLCRDCGGSYTLLRGTPDLSHTPPLHCVWCASTSLIINPQDTEDTCWTVLALKYHLSVDLTQKVYQVYATHPQGAAKGLSFSAFLSTPDMQAAIQVLAAAS